MVPFVFFLTTLVLFGALAWTLTSLGMRGRWQREGPAGIALAVRRRNRLVAIGVLVFLVVLAFLEAVSVDVHENVLLALQFGVGDAAGSDPIGIWETESGGVSWAFYLSVLTGSVAGLVLGSWARLKGYANTSMVSPVDLV